MKIISFAEGAHPRRGGVGLVGVPHIVGSVAARGNNAVLIIGGPAIVGAENLVKSNIKGALHQKYGAGTFGIVTYPAYFHWRFAPSMLWQLSGYFRDVDFVSLHSFYSFPVLTGYLLCRHYHKPYGIWPHGVLAPFQREISKGRKTIYNRLIMRHIINNASVIFYSAPGEREEARCLDFKTPSVIVPHGFDAHDFLILPPRGQFRHKYLHGHTGPLVLFLSRLNAKKGLDLLAQAFAIVIKQMPEARLAIVGSGDPPGFESKVLEWLQKCGAANYAVMPGLLIGEEKLQAFADADVFVLPSEAENFGFVVFEAMASHIPVVVSDTLNYANEFDKHQTGLIVPRKPEAFAEAILTLLRSPRLRKDMGENGLRLAQEYSWENNGRMVELTIQCILQNRPLPEELNPQ